MCENELCVLCMFGGRLVNVLRICYESVVNDACMAFEPCANGVRMFGQCLMDVR